MSGSGPGSDDFSEEGMVGRWEGSSLPLREYEEFVVIHDSPPGPPRDEEELLGDSMQTLVCPCGTFIGEFGIEDEGSTFKCPNCEEEVTVG